MLTAACAALAVTALLAGFTGSWSPCGLSSIETIGSGMGRDPSRRMRAASLAIFSACCLIGGVATFGGVSLAGAALGLGGGEAAAGFLAAAAALVAGALDLRFLPVRPQVRNQVPESVRRRAPLPVTSALYGLMLGLGFTTYLLTWAMWALIAGCLLIASPAAGLAIGLAFGAGRALPVIVLAGRYERASTQRFILDMETGPLLKGLRRIDGVALIVCAALIVPVAAAGAARLPGFGYNPSADDSGATVFARHGQTGGLLRVDGSVGDLPGTDPAAGGGLVAWRNTDAVTVARAADLAVAAQFTIPGVNALALDGATLAYRTTDAAGRDTIAARPIAGGEPVTLASYTPPSMLSRPSVSGGTVVFGVSGRTSTRIVAIAANGDNPRVVRRDSPWRVVGNPSLAGNALLYVRTGYCDQTLMLGELGGRASGRDDRVKLRIRATVRRDPGHEPGHIDAYDKASKCRRHKYARYSGDLWTTSLTPTRALATLLTRDRSKPRVISLAR